MAEGAYLARPAPSGLADVVDVVLSRGIVIDAQVRVSLLGIELVTLEARIVVASVDSYLRYAEATNRLDLAETGGESLPQLVEDGAGAVIERTASAVVGRSTEQDVDSVAGAVADVAEKAVDTVVGKAVDVLLPGDGTG